MNANGTNKTKKRAAATAAAVIAAAGTVLGGSFDSPADLMDDDDAMIPAQTAQTAEYAADDECDGGGDDAGEPEKRSLRRRVRRLVQTLPAGVRAAVGVPLWCVGWLVITAVSALWSAVLSPVADMVLRCAATAGIMLAVIFAMMKIVFPDMPVKRIFNRRSILTALFGTAAVGAADALMCVFLPEERTAAELVRFFGSLAVFTLSALPLISAEVERIRAERVREEEEDREEYLRRLALEIADSAAAK